MIARKTWREVRWMALVYTIILGLMLVPAMILWPDVYDDLRRGSALLSTVMKLDFLKGAAEGMRDADEQAAFLNWMGVQMFFKGTNVAGIACAILLGTGLIARERENHTLEFLLSRRVGRSRVLWNKFWVISICLAVPVYLTSWMAIPIAESLDYELPFAEVTQAATHASLFLVFMLALCTVFTVWCRYQVHVAFWIGGIVILSLSMFFVPVIKDFSIFKLSDYEVYNPVLAGNMDWPTMIGDYTLWVVLATIGCYVVADRIFQRAEL